MRADKARAARAKAAQERLEAHHLANMSEPRTRVTVDPRTYRIVYEEGGTEREADAARRDAAEIAAKAAARVPEPEPVGPLPDVVYLKERW